MSLLDDIQPWVNTGLTLLKISVSAVVVLYIIFLVTAALYNIYLHPLSHFPGPKFAAISQIPYVRALVSGKMHLWVKELHEHYDSDVIRISPLELSFINSAAWNDINGHRQGRQDYEKDLTVYGKPPNGVDSLLTADTPDHSRMRRVTDHAFSDKSFREQEPMIQSYVDNLVKQLHEQVKGPLNGKVDLVKWYEWTSFDIIGELAFGEPFDCLQNHTHHPWVEMIFGNLKNITFMGACLRFPIFNHLLPLLIPKSLTKMKDDHWAYTTSKISNRIELKEDRPDFMSPILKHNIEGKGLTKDEMQSNASLFIIAGSEAVATVLSGSTYYLLKNPEMMKKLTAEIRGAFKTEADITAQSVGQLPYLIAVLTETMRIYPTALTGQATRTPFEGDTICGYWVCGDTGVTINQYAAYRSPKNFTQPNTYLPDRWLPDPTSNFAADQKPVFQPFSFGPRACPGKTLGNAETRLILTKLLWNFDLELCAETGEKWEDQRVYLSWQKKPLIVTLIPRKI